LALTSSDGSHNKRSEAKPVKVWVLCHELHSTHSLSASSAARQWVFESRFPATLKIRRKFRFLTKTKFFSAFCSELYKDLFKQQKCFGFIGTLSRKMFCARYDGKLSFVKTILPSDI